MEGLTPGRMVHYVLAESDYVNPESAGAHRPAVVVVTYAGSDTLVNLDVLLDGENDAKYAGDRAPLMHARAVEYDPLGAVGTWHWIERA